MWVWKKRCVRVAAAAALVGFVGGFVAALAGLDQADEPPAAPDHVVSGRGATTQAGGEKKPRLSPTSHGQDFAGLHGTENSPDR
jgi:hypothetical protein